MRWVKGRGTRVKGRGRVVGSLRSRPVASRRDRSPSTLNTQPSTPRSGSVLLIVLVVIVMLTFATYVFTQSMVVERHASNAFAEDVRARTCVDSAVELTAAYLGEPVEPGHEGFYHRTDLFQGAIVYDATENSSAGRFSIVAPVPTTSNSVANRLRFGLVDESAKLNVNSLVSEETEDVLFAQTNEDGFLPMAVAGDLSLADDLDYELVQRERLLVIPGMTEELADCILDFIDEDEDIRPFGAEAPEYEQYGYYPADGPLESIDQLLLVKGVTRALLYGEDTNRNGLLDPNEDDGNASLPLDDQNGILNPGWLAYLTVGARESNLRTDGSDKIDLNEPLLTDLFDTLIEDFSEEEAQFITAFRIAGPIDQDVSTSSPLGQLASGGEEAMQQLAVEIAKAVANGEEGEVTRAGLDLGDGGVYNIDSLYDLIDAEVEIEVDGVLTTLTSPWSSNDMDTFFADFSDLLTTRGGSYFEGRVNVNEARYETLLTVPGMTEDLAMMIVDSSPIADDGTAAPEELARRSTTAWLVTSGIVDLPTMRKLDRHLTARGAVYRAQIVGFFDHGGPAARFEATFDTTVLPVRVMTMQDLTPLGMGYPRTWLAPPQTGLVSGSTTTGQ